MPLFRRFLFLLVLLLGILSYPSSLHAAYQYDAKTNTLQFVPASLSSPSTRSFGNLMDPSALLRASSQLVTTTPTPTTALSYTKVKELLARLDALDIKPNSAYVTPGTSRHLASPKTDKIVVPTPTLSNSELIANVSEVLGRQTDVAGAETDELVSLGNLSENPIKTTYTIAILGDSMVDTIRSHMEQLRALLKTAYPTYSFALLNFGQGSTDLDNGAKRLTQGTMYLNTYHPAVLSYKPDILVIESFAYNHWSGAKHDLDRQWLAIANMLDTIRIQSPTTKVLLATTIGPNSTIFGDGVLNWNKDLKWEAVRITKAYLENFVNFATSQQVPLANAYTPSLLPSGEGNPKFISSGDHLHPSEAGARLFFQHIVDAIQTQKLLPE